jgi:hypothetical protein
MYAICPTESMGGHDAWSALPRIQPGRKQMVLQYFDTKASNAFGESLAEYFIKEIPLLEEDKKIKERDLKKQFRAIDEMRKRMDKFKLENKLNLYKKAALGTAFKSRLIAAGYDPNLVDVITKKLLV